MNDPDIATHEAPAWRERANYILQVDLADHGLPGLFEQVWARELGGGRFELCCLPFFAYGYALGDIVGLQAGAGRFAEVLSPVLTDSGRGLLRIFLTDRNATHEDLHGAVAASGRPHEWRAGGLVAVDIEHAIPDALTDVIDRLAAKKDAEWEWGKRPNG